MGQSERKAEITYNYIRLLRFYLSDIRCQVEAVLNSKWKNGMCIPCDMDWLAHLTSNERQSVEQIKSFSEYHT